MVKDYPPYLDYPKPRQEEPSCKVCERITEANKDIFWVFARTHQPGTQEEFLRIPYKDVRFCPVCGREIGKINNMTTIL